MLDPVGRQEVLSAVHKLNREKGITVVNLEYLCKVLDVSLQDFFSYTGSEVRGELTALVSELTQEQQAALCAFLKTM